MKKIERRRKKNSNTMTDEKFNYLVEYLYDYESKNLKRPPIKEYSKKVAEWDAEHQYIPNCTYDDDSIIS